MSTKLVRWEGDATVARHLHTAVEALTSAYSEVMKRPVAGRTGVRNAKEETEDVISDFGGDAFEALGIEEARRFAQLREKQDGRLLRELYEAFNAFWDAEGEEIEAVIGAPPAIDRLHRALDAAMDRLKEVKS